MKSQSTKNPVRIIPCGALFESYGQTLDPSKYCPELPEAQCMLAEGVGFEPTIRNYRIPDFESGAFDLSATLPRQERRWIVSALTRKARPPTEKSIPVFDGLSIPGRASVHYFAAGTIFSLPFM